MGTENFIELLKKELLRQSTGKEKDELMTMVKEDEDFAAVYTEIFPGQEKMNDTQETGAAFVRHLTRMKNLKLL